MASTLAIKARLGAQLAAATAATVARRARRGPRRPGWPLSLEVTVAFLRRAHVAQALLPWAEQRALGDAMGSLGRRVAGVDERSDTIAGVPGVWFRSAAHDAERGPVVVYLHGGSYLYGSVASHRELVARIAKASEARVFLPLYRLAPEHPFPAAIDDAVAVTAAIVSAVSAPRVALAGDSAGGGLAVATLLRLRDEGRALPAAAALISPWVELDARGGSLERNLDDWGEPWMFVRWAEAYLAGHDPRDPLASPGHAALRGLPPLRVDVGAAEMLRDQVVRFADRAVAAGVDTTFEQWPEMVHDFQLFAATLPMAQRAVDALGAFVRARTAP